MSSQDWSWAHEPGPIDPRPIDPSRVTAILVVHNAADWLPRTLAALAALEQPVRVVAVDNGSHDHSPALLDGAQQRGALAAVLLGESTDGFGQAVQRAVETLYEPGEDEWLWLLHDDVEPRPDCLTELLRATQAEPAADLLFPKLLEPRRRNHPDRIGEVGQSISSAGHRVALVEQGDLDQHQMGPTEVLGGSSAGLLVRRCAWQQLGGMDASIPFFRDGLELGWRANQNGLRVLTCPTAALHHRRAGRTWRRESTLAPNPELTDRLLGYRLVAAHSRHRGLTTLRLALGGLLAVLGHLLGKAPQSSAAALGAVRGLLGSGSQTAALQRRLPAPDEAADLSRLRPRRGHMLRLWADQAAGWVADRVLPERETEVTLDELTTDEAPVHEQRRSHAVAWLVAAVAVLTVVAGRRLFGFGELNGPGMAPAPGTLAGAWDAWAKAPLGVDGGNAPWLALAALGSTLFTGRPEWFAVAANLLAVPLAMLASLPLWRRLLLRPERAAGSAAGVGWPGRRGSQIALLALGWGLLQPLVGVTGSGRASGILLGSALPLAAAAWLSWWRGGADGVERWRAPAAFALFSLLCTLALPALWPLGLVAALLAAWHSTSWPTATLMLVPLLALGGWLPRLLDEPARLLTGTDPRLDATLNTPWWIFWPAAALLWLAAGVGLWRREQDRTASAVAGPALVALAVACWAAGLALPTLLLPGRGDDLLRPDGQAWLLLAGLALLVLTGRGWCPTTSAAPGAVTAAPGARRLSGGSWATLANLATALLAAFVLAAGSWWAVAAGEPVHRSRSELPAHVTAVLGSARHSRVLMVDLTGGTARWSITADDQPRWGSAEHPVVPGDQARGQAESLVAALASGAGTEQLAGQAITLDIGHLWLRGADDELVQAISNSAGLGPAEREGDATTWTVVGPVQRHQEWYVPRSWWPTGLLALGTATLLLLAAPSSRAEGAPRRAATGRKP